MPRVLLWRFISTNVHLLPPSFSSLLSHPLFFGHHSEIAPWAQMGSFLSSLSLPSPLPPPRFMKEEEEEEEEVANCIPPPPPPFLAAPRRWRQKLVSGQTQ